MKLFTSNTLDTISDINDKLMNISNNLIDVAKDVSILSIIDEICDMSLDDILNLVLDEDGVYNEDMETIAQKMYNTSFSDLNILEVLYCIKIYHSDDSGIYTNKNITVFPSVIEDDINFRLECSEPTIKENTYLALRKSLVDHNFNNGNLDEDSMAYVSEQLSNVYYNFKKPFIDNWNTYGKILCNALGVDPEDMIKPIMEYQDFTISDPELLYNQYCLMVLPKGKDRDNTANAIYNITSMIRREHSQYPENHIFIDLLSPNDTDDWKLTVKGWDDEDIIVALLNDITFYGIEPNRKNEKKLTKSLLSSMVGYTKADILKYISLVLLIIYKDKSYDDVVERATKILRDNGIID